MAYVVDAIADGEQLVDSGIIPTEDDAWEEFTKTEKLTKALVKGFWQTKEVTIRLIENGNVLAETTITKE